MSDSSRDKLLFILEDDQLVAPTLTQTLGEYGFVCRWFRRAAELMAALSPPPALTIVDLGLPDGDGLDVVREMQQRCDCGILILTGRGFLSDRILGLELGADDYVVKPFEPRELVARIRSILRRRSRSSGPASETRRIACFDQWRFDPASFSLIDERGQEEILGSAEARTLQMLLEKPSRVLTREQLSGGLDLAPYDRSIDVRISRLRRKLRDDLNNPHLIKTVYGVGYLLAAKVAWTEQQQTP